MCFTDLDHGGQVVLQIKPEGPDMPKIAETKAKKMAALALPPRALRSLSSL